jgi:hypothetical protein
MIQLPHVIARLVIPANHDRKERRLSRARVVLVKRPQRAEFGRYGERGKVVFVPESLGE